MRRWTLLLAMLATTLRLCAQTETVNGTVDNPNGSPFNGTFSITLVKSSVVNICATPAQVVPFPGLTVKVVAGVFTATQLIPTSCLMPSLPYYVRVFDSTGKQIYSDNWYVPPVQGGVVNVGTLGSVQLASGIIVSVPLAIISTPSSNQTVTQPSGTTLSVNYLTVTGSFTVAQYLGPVTAPAGSCSTNGAWVFSRDGHGTFCNSGIWQTKI